MGYRLIVLDLDGTALDTQKRIHPATKAAVDTALARGIPTVLATGRHHRMAVGYHEQFGQDMPMIACNGACVLDPVSGRLIVERPMAGEKVAEILAIARRHKVWCHLYTAAAVHHETNANDPAVSYITQAPGAGPAMLQAFEPVPSLDRFLAEERHILKLVVFNPDIQHVHRCLEEIAPIPGLSCEWSWAFGADISAAGNTKGRALLDLAATMGIAAEEIIAIGDNHNDITMLKAAGTGVAMGNAEAEVRAAADWVTGTNDENGVVTALQRFVL